jgi:hypothetical protein
MGELDKALAVVMEILAMPVLSAEWAESMGEPASLLH